MNFKNLNVLFTFFISIVWFVNGFFCKVLNYEPRHKQIISRILGIEYADELTLLIGVAEIGMVLWILSGYKAKINVVFQITIIITMNIIEFFLTEDLLLWGKLNIVFAGLFVVMIYSNEFLLKRINYDVIS